MSTQNIQKTLLALPVAGTWYNFTPKMDGILREVNIVHNGVSDDRATDFGLTIKRYQGARVDADPDYNLNQVSDNQKLIMRDADIHLSFASDVNNGTVYIEETEMPGVIPLNLFSFYIPHFNQVKE